MLHLGGDTSHLGRDALRLGGDTWHCGRDTLHLGRDMSRKVGSERLGVVSESFISADEEQKVRGLCL
jgi:hypothetical protein